MNTLLASSFRAYVVLAMVPSLLIACSSTSTTATPEPTATTVPTATPTATKEWLDVRACIFMFENFMAVGKAWIDKNENGERDGNEQGLENVQFWLEVEVTYAGKEPRKFDPPAGISNKEGEIDINVGLYHGEFCEGTPHPIGADVVVHAEAPPGYRHTTPERLSRNDRGRDEPFLFGFTYIDTPVPTATQEPVRETTTPTAEATQTAPSLPPSTTTEAPPAAELAILSFNVDVEDIPAGKRLTFRWQTTGAVRAIVWSGTRHRFPEAWEVLPNGTLTVELSSTIYRNPSMFLTAYDAKDNQVSSPSVTVPWPCAYDYFFETRSDVCPSGAAISTWTAEQSFQNGRMIWLEQAQTGGAGMLPQILVFYDDGRYEQHEDTWIDAEPESDPAIVPPAGLFQPVRGFGKIWRENPCVRDRLGWATAPEQGFDTQWQLQIRESIPSVAFVRTLAGQVIQINGWGWNSGGDWQIVTP